jgi:hypothetical protein
MANWRVEKALQWLFGVLVRNVHIDLIFIAFIRRTFGTYDYKRYLLGKLKIIGKNVI